MAQVVHGTVAPEGRPRIGRLDVALVVACLGMLAAVAVPRQQNLTAETHRAEVSALADSIRSAAHFGHTLWQARGRPASVDLGRRHIGIVNGYPAAADLALLLEQPEVMAFRHAGGTWQHRDRGAGEPCGVSYAPPRPGAREPNVRLRVSGC